MKCSQVPIVNFYSIATGSSTENVPLNRYSDIQPYDRTRVMAPSSDDPSTLGYLNASWVLERFGHKWWIAAQAPLRYSAHSFIRTIVQPIDLPYRLLNGENGAKKTQIRTVVQLTLNEEGGRRKADTYFPDTVGSSLVLHPETGCYDPLYKVKLVASRTIPEAHCLHRTVAVYPANAGANSTSSVVFQHLLYTSWPDHGVPEPEVRDSLLAFVKLVDSINRDKTLSAGATQHESDDLDPDPPVIVGCSAGVGRTGSFIAMSSLLRDAGVLPPADAPTPLSACPPSPLGSIPKEFGGDRVVQEIDFLRDQRPGMVQRPAQMELVYEVFMDAFTGGQ